MPTRETSTQQKTGPMHRENRIVPHALAGPPLVPSLNILWFWFANCDDPAIIGSVEDIERKWLLFRELGGIDDGAELYCFPSALPPAEYISEKLCADLNARAYVTLHIGERDQDFLFNIKDIRQQLHNVRAFMRRLGTQRLILHATHFQRDIEAAGRLLAEACPDCEILVENTGHNNEWGHEISHLSEIFSAFPEFRWCLDICHVEDFPDMRLEQFLDKPVLAKRLAQIHYSCSTKRLGYNPYERQGIVKHSTYHALFSIAKQEPRPLVHSLVQEVPTVIEGILPAEDRELRWIKEERRLLE